MATIEDPSPPAPPAYVENSIESGDGRAKCAGCCLVHGSAGRQIACMAATIEGLRERVTRDRAIHLEEMNALRAKHREEVEALKAANRAAVQAASLQTSKGGLAETRKRDGGG